MADELKRLVCLVEDDPLMVRMYERILKFKGFEVTMAFDGEEGLHKLKDMHPKPTVVLLDMMMPKMNGMEVLKAVKADAELKDIPVIVLSNLAGKEDVDKALQLGAVAYLIKSQYEPKEIIAKIEEVIEALPK